MEAFTRDPILQRETDKFREAIPNIITAEQLVADYEVLKVALGAFGLDEEIGKKAFLEQILSEDPDDSESLVNRFVDPRYGEFARAFGFGSGIPQTLFTGFADDIISRYETNQFEIAVGTQDETMRFALSFTREIADLAQASLNGQETQTGWLNLMGDEPTRRVLDRALGLPDEFATLDIDVQIEEYQRRMRTQFGGDSMAVFADPEVVDTVLNRYLLREQAEAGPTAGTPGYSALQVLQAGSASTGITNLILSATL